MASHDESGKKSNENEVPTFNAENLQSNMKVVYYSRTFMSIIGGVIAGICGFTGLMGFVVYVLVMAITSVCLTAWAGFSIRSYFDSWNRVLLDGFLGGLLSFVLFWTYPFVLDLFLYHFPYKSIMNPIYDEFRGGNFDPFASKWVGLCLYFVSKRQSLKIYVKWVENHQKRVQMFII